MQSVLRISDKKILSILYCKRYFLNFLLKLIINWLRRANYALFFAFFNIVQVNATIVVSNCKKFSIWWIIWYCDGVCSFSFGFYLNGVFIKSLVVNSDDFIFLQNSKWVCKLALKYFTVLSYKTLLHAHVERKKNNYKNPVVKFDESLYYAKIFCHSHLKW